MIELNKLLKQIQNINLGRFSKIDKAYVIGKITDSGKVDIHF